MKKLKRWDIKYTEYAESEATTTESKAIDQDVDYEFGRNVGIDNQYTLSSASRLEYSKNKSLRALLSSRGIHSIEEFLKYSTIDISALYSFELLPSIEIAVERIYRAVQNDELIYVYGDYDTDGITSSAVMVKALSALGARVDYYLPDRFEEGYGISKDGLSKILQKGASLVISVDCGIVSVEEAKFVQEIGLDLIITDHHNPQDEIPKALAVIDPKLEGSNYPFKELAGVGVAYKLACAILKNPDKRLMDELLLLVAIGTVADLVPMVDENRLLVKEGLGNYAKGLNYGLDALIDIAKIDANELLPDDIAFSISPRLNSAGRLAHASIGLELLLSKDYESAYAIADELNKLNSQRQYKTAQIVKVALEMIDANPICSSDKITIVWGENWHEGVLGIVAAKLVEKYSRPAIVLSLHDGMLKGSARSIKGFSIFECLYSMNDVLTKFGGHNQAAGLSLSYELLDYFIEGIKRYCDENLTEDMLIPSVDIDSVIDINDLNMEFYNMIMKLQPFGVSNKMPLLCARAVNISEFRLVGKSLNHLKFSTYNHGVEIGGIKFFYEGYIPKVTRDFMADICFELSQNHYNGITSLQLKLSDIRLYDPNSSDFAKRAYILYIIRLFKLLKANDEPLSDKNSYDEGVKKFINDVEYVSKEYKKREISDIIKSINENSEIVITSYEAFLELMYVMYDLSYISLDFGEDFFEKFSNIKLLPQSFDSTQMFDFPLLYVGIEDYFKNVKNCDIMVNGFDNEVLFHSLMGAKFDRNRSIELYMKIKAQHSCNIFEEFINSSNIINDLVIWSFFEEANFIYSDDYRFYCVEEEHRHHNFKNSKIEKKLENLLISRRIKTWI